MLPIWFVCWMRDIPALHDGIMHIDPSIIRVLPLVPIAVLLNRLDIVKGHTVLPTSPLARRGSAAAVHTTIFHSHAHPRPPRVPDRRKAHTPTRGADSHLRARE